MFRSAGLGIILMALAVDANAAFVKTSDIQLTTPGILAITFDANNFYTSTVFSREVNRYDSQFSFLDSRTFQSSIQAAPRLANIGGLAYDAKSNHLWIADSFVNSVHEFTLTGTEIRKWTTGGQVPNGIALDPLDGSLWMSTYNDGRITHWSASGQLLGGFVGGPRWSGITIDPVARTLLAIDENDLVWEYRTDGTALGQIIAADEIAGNGMQLSYDPATARLYASAQEGGVVIFQDATRAVVPIPPAVWLFGSALGLMGAMRRKISS